jgi:myo-inositol-hexaphosphate 3-phosphohydrolase
MLPEFINENDENDESLYYVNEGSGYLHHSLNGIDSYSKYAEETAGSEDAQWRKSTKQ